MSHSKKKKSNIPNFAFNFGNSNSSYTLKVDGISYYISNLINYMNKNKYDQFCPRPGPDEKVDENAKFWGLNSSYITRSMKRLPKQGFRRCWRTHEQSMLYDYFLYHYAPYGKELEFSKIS